MSRLGRPALLAALVIAAAAILAACGGTAPASVGPVPSGTISVEAKEYQFTPSAISAPAGRVTFAVRNAGSVEHEFEIFKGDQVVDEVEGLVPGLQKTLTVDLAAGEYTYVCKLSGHDQLGMKGTLTVN
ncbi:MAG TPA: cupredoxin domain-containing protein [Candidatus Limnocylindrales bacterium]|nr:cupredoxin domain-containing protein [Candidatus Limnocylindrales bacterium]